MSEVDKFKPDNPYSLHIGKDVLEMLKRGFISQEDIKKGKYDPYGLKEALQEIPEGEEKQKALEKVEGWINLRNKKVARKNKKK